MELPERIKRVLEQRQKDLRRLHYLMEPSDVADWELLPNPHTQLLFRRDWTSEQRLLMSRLLTNIFGVYTAGKTSNVKAIRACHSLNVIVEETNRPPRPWESNDPYSRSVDPGLFQWRWENGYYLMVYRRGRPGTDREKLSAIPIDQFLSAFEAGKPCVMTTNVLTWLKLEEMLDAEAMPCILVYAPPEDHVEYQEMRQVDAHDSAHMNLYGLALKEEDTHLSGTIWLENQRIPGLRGYTEEQRQLRLIPQLVRRLGEPLSEFERQFFHEDLRESVRLSGMTRDELLVPILFRQTMGVELLSDWYWLQNEITEATRGWGR